MLSRTTRTNEPARCAVLLPLLARLPQPLVLLEVGGPSSRRSLGPARSTRGNADHVSMNIGSAVIDPAARAASYASHGRVARIAVG
jgi:hypothetical protein